MKEKDFWTKIKSNLEIEFLERVEHKNVAGWPDVHYCHPQKFTSGWIELKVTNKFPTTMPYRPAQPLWHDTYWKAGGLCFTLLYVISENTMYLWKGCHSLELNKHNGPKNVEPELKVQLDKVGWKNLKDCLFSFA